MERIAAKKAEIGNFIRSLKQHRLSKQQIKTLRGQALDPPGAGFGANGESQILHVGARQRQASRLQVDPAEGDDVEDGGEAVGDAGQRRAEGGGAALGGEGRGPFPAAFRRPPTPRGARPGGSRG